MAGYSGTPLWRKLGLKDGMRGWVAGAPDAYAEMIAGAPDVMWQDDPEGAGFCHLFTTSRDEMASRLPDLMDAMARDGMIWVSWPKKASKVPTDMTEDAIRAAALPLGLVDVKVCAVDAVWSGLKLVIRKALR